jgi:opacity protein-like surface antigen
VERGTKNLIMRLATVAVVALLCPRTSSAQANAGVSLTAADPPRWEVSGDIGWLSSNKSEIGPDWNDWYDVLSAGGSTGYYVTANLKAELRLAFSGEGSIYQEEPIDVPGQPFPGFRLREHHFRATTMRGGMTYQFFQNQWFHPHVGAGVEIARESDRMFTQSWRVPSREPGAPLVIPAVDGGTTVSWAVRPVVSTGFKWYVSERGFIRSDVSVAMGDKRAAQVAWTAGIGVDL